MESYEEDLAPPAAPMLAVSSITALFGLALAAAAGVLYSHLGDELAPNFSALAALSHY